MSLLGSIKKSLTPGKIGKMMLATNPLTAGPLLALHAVKKSGIINAYKAKIQAKGGGLSGALSVIKAEALVIKSAITPFKVAHLMHVAVLGHGAHKLHAAHELVKPLMKAAPKVAKLVSKAPVFAKLLSKLPGVASVVAGVKAAAATGKAIYYGFKALNGDKAARGEALKALAGAGAAALEFAARSNPIGIAYSVADAAVTVGNLAIRGKAEGISDMAINVGANLIKDGKFSLDDGSKKAAAH